MTSLPIFFTDKTGRPVVIRRFVDDDRAALARMYDSFLPKRCAQGLPPDTEPARARWLERVLGRGYHLVVLSDDDLVGHGMLIPLEPGVAELADFVHQSVRNRGIGTELNRALVDNARHERLDRLWLSVEPSNRAAIRSYETVGFKRLNGSLWAPEMEMEANLVRSDDESRRVAS